MNRIIKYMKPYALVIVVTVLLLFGQAVCDLSLPDYMSKIVNTGIQQGGIEDAVPTVMSESIMRAVLPFLSEGQQDAVREHYTLVSAQDAQYAKLEETFRGLNGASVYALNKVDDSTRESMNAGLSYGFAAVTIVQQMEQAASTQTQVQGDAALITQDQMPPALMQFFGYAMQQGTDFFTALADYPDADAVYAALNELIQPKLSAYESSMLTQLAIPAIQSEYETLGADAAKMQNDYILNAGLIMLLFALGSAACTIVVGLTSARVGSGLARDLREKMFVRVSKFSNIEFDKFSTASLITRSTNDVTQIQMTLILMLRMVFYAPIMGVGGIIMALSKSVSMTWTIALAVVVLIAFLGSILAVAMPKFKKIQSLIDKMNLVMRENLSGMMVVRAFGRQRQEEQRFDNANIDLTKTNLFVNRAMSLMMPVMMLIMNATSILIIWVGAQQIADSTLQVGSMMAFMQYAIQIVMSFLMLTMMFVMLPRASVSAGRVADVLDTDIEIHDAAQPKKFEPHTPGVLRFDHVDFMYPGAEENVLTDINFTAQPGQTTAIIGSTGSGKSTVANLIPRFYDVSRGSITIDGMDIREVSQHDLREEIGYVTQKAVLFMGSIRDNLTFGSDEATDAQVEEAARDAQALDFIEKKEEGFESYIAQGGANVSGGQKQRLSIARALVKNPRIYIFDDCFSALDFKTDATLRAAIKEQTADKTVLIIAQRVGTIMDAAQIIVLDEGRIVGKGTHKELMQGCQTYREIALSQLSEEELA